MRRLLVILLAVVGGLSAVGYAMATQADSPSDTAEDATVGATPPATTEVVVRDMVATEELQGTLGYGESSTLVAAAEGVVTSAATVGTVLQPGDVLVAVDLEPTVLLAGAIPMFRDLDTSVEDGPDVQQLEEWLVASGHAADLDLTVDETFTSVTATAVEAWETALGRLDPDGEVGVADVVFTTGTVRVDSVAADVGSRVQAGSELLSATGTELVVAVDLDTDDLDQLPLGATVDLELPDGTPTTGTVATIGVDAESTTDTETDTTSDPSVPVIITLDDPTATDIEAGTVAVTVETAREDDVVAVDVTALLALAEGGYALEVVDGGSTGLVGVEVGTFADGFVAVTGVEPGTSVVVPS
ncbi:HlyD family efflux transporter periplasmic adaptor subunit [Euzebya rosea]|uniref:HlyD family efflux transporter periplasmic adaptor subunit n=1 Tax=Euzebya rosea TaxID=2052804 RepID=UPI000D3E896A|nr:HlyD family efflux transporter periplasmic adaptor subunit [Euzebya rosea]